MKRFLAVMFALLALSSCGAFIHGAAKYNKLERVKKYVADGHINDREEVFQHTPLMVAAYYGHAEIVQYLCEHNADLDARAADGSTALIYAAYSNYPQVVEILLNSGAAINLKDSKGHTALYYADAYRFYHLAEMLTQRGGIKD